MKKIIAIFSITISGFFSHAQVKFQKTIGGPAFGEVALSVQQISDGFIIAGSTGSFGAGGGDVYIIKTNQFGSVLWTRSFGGIDYDNANCVKQTPDGGFIISGSWRTPVNSEDLWLIKVDGTGALLWSRTFTGSQIDVGLSVQPTTDGGLIVAGRTNSFGFGSDDFILMKTDGAGNIQWANQYSGTMPEVANSVQQTSDGGYVMTGFSVNYGNPASDILVVKTDSAGAVQWSKAYHAPNNDFSNCIRQTNDGGYIISGYTTSFGAGNSDLLLIKTDTAGDITWSKTYGGVLLEGGSYISLDLTHDGGYILGASTNSFGAGNYDFYAVKTDSLGSLQWSRTYGGIYADQGSAVISLDSGGYVMVGYTSSFGNSGEIYFIRTDSSGNSGCNESIPSTITTTPAFNVIDTVLSVFPPNFFVSPPPTFIDSGGVASTLCFSNNANGIYENDVNNTLAISPNPSSDFLSIQYNLSSSKETEISLFNLYGQKIKTIYNGKQPTGAHEIKADMKDIATGIYLVVVTIAGERMVKKMVKK